MDWNLFWSAFGAIGTTVGSLITGVAVVVAVKQYKQPLEKKIVVSYGTTLPIMTDNSMGSKAETEIICLCSGCSRSDLHMP